MLPERWYFVKTSSSQLKNFILDSGLVSRAVYTSAEKDAEEKKTTPEEILVSKGNISEDDLRRMQAYVLGVPFINLANEKIGFEVLSMIPEPIARTHNIIAYNKSDRELEVAMLDVEDLQAIEFIKKKVGLKILPRLTDAESIKHALLQYQKTLKDEFGDLIKRESASISILSEEEDGVSESDLKKLAEDVPVVRVVNALLKHAIIQNASDIHIEPMENEVLVRYRIDGLLHDAMTLPKNTAASITARIKVLSNLKLDEKRLPQDGRFKMAVDNEKVSFRVSLLPTYYGEKTVMRLLRENGGGYSLEGLGFHGQGLERLHHAMKQTTGMILTSGPTGSGKTTTLYTILDLLNTPNVNISTIEDPIEYQMARVNQTQVRPEIDFTFSRGLRALVRQDPDIIMVGEIRDSETASLAVNASLTGHLVLSTLHTNSAAGAIPRLMDMGVEPFLLSSTIRVVIGQRLVRRLFGPKESYKLSKEEIVSLKKVIDFEKLLTALRDENVIKKTDTVEDLVFSKPLPSEDAPDGYKGRMVINEVLMVSSAINELIIKQASSDKIEAQARSEGMLTMAEDGFFKAVQGGTTIEEVLRVISE
ncbi:MAG: Type II secretion system protein E [Parcubacteria group bacterium GW2011_GWD2_42_14]|nr:MAG: Type II secretion system protein E [Parcubacteria group bacterium GW2011_GWD2_42_14]